MRQVRDDIDRLRPLLDRARRLDGFERRFAGSVREPDDGPELRTSAPSNHPRATAPTQTGATHTPAQPACIASATILCTSAERASGLRIASSTRDDRSGVMRRYLSMTRRGHFGYFADR